MIDVSTRALHTARVSARRTRAAKACIRCKKLKTKCSGYQPCAKCIQASPAAQATCSFSIPIPDEWLISDASQRTELINGNSPYPNTPLDVTSWPKSVRTPGYFEHPSPDLCSSSFSNHRSHSSTMAAGIHDTRPCSIVSAHRFAPAAAPGARQLVLPEDTRQRHSDIDGWACPPSSWIGRCADA